MSPMLNNTANFAGFNYGPGFGNGLNGNMSNYQSSNKSVEDSKEASRMNQLEINYLSQG